MNTRIRKKIAKDYLDSGVISSKYVLGIDEWFEPENHVWKTALVVPDRLRAQIRSEAFRRGWDGCHWSDPLLFSVEETS